MRCSAWLAQDSLQLASRELGAQLVRMSRKLQAYFLAVETLAVLLLLTAPWASMARLPLLEIEGLVALIGIGILSEALAYSFVVGGNPATSSIGFLPIFAAALLFPEPAALVAGGAVMAGGEILVRRRQLFKALFNASQIVVAAAVGTVVYKLLGGRPGGEIHLSAFIGLALFFFLTNQFLSSAAFAIGQGKNFFETVSKVVGFANFIYDIFVSPVALIIVILYRQFHILGVFLVVLPLLVIRHSYVAKFQLEQANANLLRVLIKAIETRDPYTSGHSIRVSTLARMISDELGLARRSRRRIETAALLHDIGKIDVQYSNIISKPSSLSPEERAVIQSHATRGAELLRKMTSLKDDVIEGVRHHHERYDGGGYPEGLSGETIPLASRIIMLCDSIDAMLSDRPYRNALSPEAVRDELVRCSGTQFDPAIVSVITEGDLLERAAALVADSFSELRPAFGLSEVG